MVFLFFLTLLFLVLSLLNIVKIRQAFILTWVFFLLFVNISTEILSLCNAFDFYGLLMFYGLVNIAMLYFITTRWQAIYARLLAVQNYFSREEWLLWIPVVLIMVVAGFTAIYFPPNNWDSMTYNLARVVHWIQNNNVEHYPTHISRQLFNPPLAEYAIAHVYILNGGDRFVNCIQFISFVQCGLVVSLLIQILGYSKKAQWFGILVVFTLPNMILQASNTKVELTLCFFLASSIYYAIRYFNEKNVLFAVLAALCISLSLLSKGSGIIFIVPFFGVYFIHKIFNDFKGALKFAGIAMLTILVINTPFYMRNYKTYHDIMGPEGFKNYHKNEDFSPGYLLSNLVRQSSINVAGAFIFSNSDTRNLIEQVTYHVHKLHHKLNIDINNPKTTLAGTTYEFFPNRDEDYAGNLIQSILAFVCFLFIIIQYVLNAKKYKGLLLYTLASLSTFLFFCIYLKWSPWHGRLQLPFFVLASVYIGCCYDFFSKFFRYLVTIILGLYCIPYLFSNGTRSLVKQEEGMFFNKTRDELMFKKKGSQPLNDIYEIADYCTRNNIKSVGLWLQEDSWDYPFFLILKRDNPDLHIYHVNVNPYPNGNYALFSVNPEVIISTESNHADSILANNSPYRNLKKLSQIDFYVE